MIWWEAAILWVLALAGVVGCGLLAGLETGIYSLNRVRLRLRVHKGDARARTLEALLHQPDAVIAALLIGTNIATNIASAAGGILLESHDLPAWRIVAYDALIVTPVLLIFAEILPKDLFAAHADRLVYPLTPLLAWLVRGFTIIPLLPLISTLNKVIVRLLGVGETASLTHPRRQVGLLVREGVGLGLLSDEQSAIAERVLGLGDRHVGDEAVPWERVTKVSVNDPPAVLWDLANRGSLSRIPVIDAGGNVLGIANLYDALLHGRESCPPIADLVKPAPMLDEAMPLRPALAELQSRGTPLAIVTRRGRPIGLVTIKDLIEPITGELASW